jgi:hypothetical protein
MILGMIAWCQWMVLISKLPNLIRTRETGPDGGSVPSSKDQDSDMKLQSQSRTEILSGLTALLHVAFTMISQFFAWDSSSN